MQLNEIPFEGHIIFCVDIMPSSADNERMVSGVVLARKWRTPTVGRFRKLILYIYDLLSVPVLLPGLQIS